VDRYSLVCFLAIFSCSAFAVDFSLGKNSLVTELVDSDPGFTYEKTPTSTTWVKSAPWSGGTAYGVTQIQSNPISGAMVGSKAAAGVSGVTAAYVSKGSIPLATGFKVPVDIKIPVALRSLAKTALAVSKAAVPLAVIPAVADWLLGAGLQYIDGQLKTAGDPNIPQSIPASGGPGTYGPAPGVVCPHVSAFPSCGWDTNSQTANSGGVWCYGTNYQNGSSACEVNPQHPGPNEFFLRAGNSVPTPDYYCTDSNRHLVGSNCELNSGGAGQPVTDDQAADAMDAHPPSDPAGVLKNTADQGYYPLPQPGDVPSATSPVSQVQGPSSTSTAANGDVVTKNTVYNIQNNNNAVTITQTTTTTTTHPNGSTDTATTTEPPPDQQQAQSDLCKEHPDVLACWQAGTDPGPQQMQSKNIDLSFTPATIPSAAGCPSPFTFMYLGISFTVPYDLICQYATGISYVFIGLAWFYAGSLLLAPLKG
jgi:hypothetical protein